jgi:hypothetical protein
VGVGGGSQLKGGGKMRRWDRMLRPGWRRRGEGQVPWGRTKFQSESGLRLMWWGSGVWWGEVGWRVRRGQRGGPVQERQGDWV